MTANRPKPLLPVVNRPIMEHVLRLLRRHGFTDTVVTVQFLASHIRGYFGDGEELGMSLSYATEDRPLGTAGSVKNAEDALTGQPFLVISGDALTDLDLTALVDYHRSRDALVTVALKRVADPLDFGIVITDDQGRVQRFLEKPTWGQVFSDTVNTGIYVMEPEVLDRVPAGEAVDWSSDVFPELLADGARLFGYVFDDYWEDVGTHESYLRAHADVLNRQVQVELDGFEVSPGIWLGEGSEVSPDAILKGPLYLGRNVRVMGGAELREFTVLGDNVVVNADATVQRAVVGDNGFVGPQTSLRGCVVGENTTILRAARVEEGAVIGPDCVVEEEAFVSADVRVYPGKTIEAGAHVNRSVIWENRGSKAVFGVHGVSGLVNVEVTPDFVVRLASAYAAVLPRGSTVITCRDASRAARTLKRAAISAMTASGINVRDLEVSATPVARFFTARTDACGGVMLRTTPGNQESIDIIFLDERGGDLSASMQRKVERSLSRQEFRRTPVSAIGELTFPAHTIDNYLEALLSRMDVSGVAESRLKLVIDAAGGAAAYVLPGLIGRLGIEALTVGVGVDERVTTESAGQVEAGLATLGELVSSAQASFGVRFDHVAERLRIVNECGEAIDDDRALLVVLDLVAAEHRHGSIALPVTTTRLAEQVTRFHGVAITWTRAAPDALTAAMAAPGTLFGGDGRGGYVVPEIGAAPDALAAFVRLVGLVARTRLSLSQIDARIPPAFVRRRDVAVPWAAKGTVMRAVMEAANGRELDTTDGVRVVYEPRRWALVLPDQSEACVHLWAEGPDAAGAEEVLDEWATVVEKAAR